jgi:hypothetical protein
VIESYSDHLAMSENEPDTTISISKSDKLRLDKLKIHRREPYRELIARLLDDLEKVKHAEGRLPSEPPRSYSSYIKGLIDSTLTDQQQS